MRICWLSKIVKIIFALAFTFSAVAWAQSYMDEPGIPAFSTAFPVENGFINLANGNLHIEIPIASYPQRGSIKTLNARLVYDGRFWTFDPNGDDPIGVRGWQPSGVTGYPQPFGVGWRLITDGQAGNPTDSIQTVLECPNSFENKFSNFAYQEPNGTFHRFIINLTRTNINCGVQPGPGTATAYALDNSGFRMDVNNYAVSAVYAPDGTQVFPQVQDTNGNYYTENLQQVTGIGYVDHVVDTLGREPVIVSFSGNPVTQVFLDYLNPQGTRSRATVSLTPLNLATQFGIGGDYTGTLPSVQSISLPDGSSYHFQYDSYGQITSMTLPTGGQVTYGYTNTTAPNQVNRWLTSRVADGNTWTFTSTMNSCTAPCNPLTVTVTTPPYNDGISTASDNHVYSFFFATAKGVSGVWPAQIQYFRGAVGGTPVLTLTKEYDNGQNNSCAQPMGHYTFVPVLIREILTWPTASGTLSKKAEYCYDSTGVNLITKKLWDYQSNGSFSAIPDREIDNTYVTDSGYVGANILTLLKTTTAKDAGGNQVAQTTRGYDEYTTQGLSLQPSGITTQHNTPSGPRGNLTSASRWLNTSPTPVVSTTAYYDTGEVYQASDPLKHSTAITYDSTGAYPARVCNALNQCSYSGYDFNTGLLTTATDANGTQLGDPLHTTTYSYDSMLRPLCTNLPDGGQTCLSYPDPNTTERQQKITTALSDFSSTILDDLGRVSQTQHSLPTCTAKTDTTYDPLGRIFSVSNPYCTTSETTYGVTQTYYDALSRPLSVIEQDGSPKAVAYSANCKTITDERGNSRRLCSNGFGELIEVDEPNSSAQGTSATASVTISGSLGSARSGTGSAPVPLSGSPLTSFVAPDGTSHIIYLASGQHVLHMFWNSTGGWQDEDLFSTTGAVTASNSGLSGVALADGSLHVFYTGTNQHIYQFVYASGGWQSQDLTAITGNVLAASGTALASDAGAAGEPVHVYYLGTNQHIYCLFVSGTTWQNQDLTAATGNTLAAAGSKLAVSVLADGTTRLFYLGTNQHVYQLFRNNGGSFGTPYLASTDYTDAQGWNSSAYYPSIRMADVNGDGKPDVCGREQAGVGCSLNNGSGTFAARQQWETSFTDGFGWNQLPYGSTFMFADLNGDHKADVCARGISGIFCEPSTGAVFGASYSATSDYNDTQSWNSPYYYPSLRLADVNGDGKPDLCGRGSGGISCSLNTGTGSFGPYQQWDASFTDANGWNQPQYTSTIMFADINGDGKADVCGRGQAGIICALSTGSAFGTTYVASTDFSDAEGWSNAAYYPSIRLADVNGDGKPDVCGRGATGVVCALNNGNGTFGPARQWDVNFTDAFGWNLGPYTSTMMLADINGDGRADVCGRGQTGIWCALSTGNASWQNQDLTAITGNTLAIAGSSLTSDAGAAGNPVHVYYIGSNQHIYSLYWNSSTLAWTNFDITANTGNTLPATGSQMSASVASDGSTHVFYLGSNQHVYQLLCCTSNWQNQDLTAITGNTLALTGTALTSTGLAGGGNIAHLYYQIGTLHLNHLFLSPGSVWTNEDLSTSESTLIADSGTVSLTAAGFTATACFGPSTNPACSGQQLNDTTSAVASALAQALNVTGSTVSATAVGSTINFTLLQPGPFTPPIASLTTAHDNSSLFSNPSFTSPATAFANGAGTPFTNGYTTLYSYDALGNLTCVEQHGNVTGTGCSAAPSSDATSPWRVRRFTYDSLSRLLTAKNPESGTISYIYDPDGNLVQKISPAPNQIGTATQTLSYCYDALHRVTGKAYSAQSCPLASSVVTYTYDSGPNAKGKLTNVTDQAGSASYSYDVLGRLASETRVIAGISKSISYDYNLDGSLKTLHYPSGRTVTYAPDSAGRIVSAIDGNGTQYVSSATYYASGAEYQRNMPGIYFRNDLNPRLQVSGFYSNNGQVGQSFLDKSYGYGALHQNNGNVISLVNNKDSNRTQTFAYDALNRITSGSSAAGSGALSWGENYSIDAWGNLMISPMGGKAHGGNFQHAGNVNNQATGLGYDAAGNLTNYTAPGQYVYDPENRLQSTAGVTYAYDADGNRVEKSGGTSSMLYWYGAPGIIAESDLSGNLKSEYVFFNGKRLARIDLPAGTAHYYLSDHLNSTSMVISGAGIVEDESDYSPYGAEYQITSGANHYKFTGKERDTESGLDYFGARYDSSAIGRFITPDPLGGEKIDPQTLNKYSYVRSNPINLIDPTGLYTCADQADCKSKQDIKFEKARQQDLKSKDSDVVRAAEAYGDPTKDGPGGNKVNVSFADLSKEEHGGKTTSTLGGSSTGFIANSEVVIDSKASGTQLEATVGHEGSHVADAQDVVKSIGQDKTGHFKVGQDITQYQSEKRAYGVSDSILRSGNASAKFECGVNPCTLGKDLKLSAQVPAEIDRILLNNYKSSINKQPLSSTNQGGSVVPH